MPQSLKKVIAQCLLQIPVPTTEKRNLNNVNHFARFLSMLPNRAGLQVLDLGIGLGYLALPMRKYYRHEVTGVDHPARKFLTKELKDLFQKNQIRLVLADMAKKLPFGDESFDIVVFSEVLEHLTLSAIDVVLNEIHRVLKKGGILLLSTPNLFSLSHRIKFAMGIDLGYTLDLNAKEGTNDHLREYSARELGYLLHKHGFAVIRIKFDNFSYNNKAIDIIHGLASFFIPSLKNDLMVVARKFSA